MKIRTTIAYLLCALAVGNLSAQTLTWLDKPADANALNPLNWDLGIAPGTGSELVFGATTYPQVTLSRQTADINSITFAADAPAYTLSLANESELTIGGTGIENLSPLIATDTIVGQRISITGGSALRFVNSAQLSGSAIRIHNNSGSVLFSDDSSAGNAWLVNEAARKSSGTALIRFNGTADAGSANIVNYGSGSVLRFEENSRTANSTIYNRYDQATIVFAGNATHNATAKIYNSGSAAKVYFIGNSSLVGNSSKFSALQKATINTANVQSNATFVNGNAIFANGTSSALSHSGLYLGGTAHAEYAIIANAGAYAAIHITDSFTANNLFLATTAASSIIHIEGNNPAAKVTLNGNLQFYANGNDPLIYIGDNVIVNGYGNFTSNGSGNLARTQFIISGNAEINAAGGNLRFRDAGTAYGSVFTINGSAKITNAEISLAGGRNINSGLVNGLTVENPHSAVIFNLCENATFNTNVAATVAGNFARLNIYGHANLTLTHASNHITFSGNYGTINISDNATVTGYAIDKNIITASGANAKTITIGGNATIKKGRIDFAATALANSTLNIEGTPTFEDFRLITRASRTISLSMGENHQITFDSIGNVGAANVATFHFSGNIGQVFQYDGLSNNPNFAFTEEGGIRATVINNAVSHTGATVTTLNLNNQNTITGEFVILNGTVNANHANALDTATLNITKNGTLGYGSVITAADEITLGGLSGDGNLSASLSEIYIGNNNYDSVFSGIVTGPGNITKIGDGTLSLAGSATFDNLTVASGYLGLSVNSDTDYTTAIIGTLNLDTTDQLRVSIAPGLGLAEGTVLPGVLTILTELNIDGVSNIAGLDDLSVNTDGRATFTFNSSTVGIYDLVAGKPLAFGDAKFAATRNQRAVGSALDEIEAAGTNTALIDGFNTLTTAQITEALNELSPAGLGAMADLAHRQAAADLRIITQRFDQYKNSPNAPLSGSRLTTGVSGANVLVPDAETATIPWTAYFAIRHSQGDKDGRRDAPGYDHDSNGISVGLDQAFAKRRGFFGFQFAYENSEADLDYSRGKVELESFRLMTYLGWFDARGLWIQAHASFNMHDYETTRNLPTLGGRNIGNTDGIGFTGSLEIGKTYDFVKPRVRIHSGDGIQTVPAKTSAWSHAPYARLTYDTANIDSFAEYGVLETDYEKQTPQNLASRLAWRLQWKSVTRKNTRLNANLDLGWEHEYMDARNDIEFRFAGTTNRRTVRGAKTARDSFVAGLNLAMLTARDLHFTLAYDLDLNADYTDHRLNIGFGKKF